VARIGGDEFIVMLPDVSDVEGARAVSENIKKTVEQPIPHGGTELQVGASIGIARFPDHGDSPETLMSPRGSGHVPGQERRERPYRGLAFGRGPVISRVAAD
jgi:predicted signal transduction protein with EAL and GGDEF domain